MTGFTCCDVLKGQREKRMYEPWCKQKLAVFTIEISLDNFITKLVQNIPATSVVSLIIV